MRSSSIALIAASFASLLVAVPAQAVTQFPRTFLSAAGLDTNSCGNAATPCRHLATAYAATQANGEIYVLDPANYGSLTIDHAVSIEGHGWASIAPAGASPAITVTANASDQINIIGVVLDGTAIAGAAGIQFNSGGSLTVRDSVIRNFSAPAIQFVPNSSTASWLFVANTLIADNQFGIQVFPFSTGTITGVIDHVQMKRNSNYGLDVQSASANTTLVVTDSVISDNPTNGIEVDQTGSTQVKVMVRNSTLTNNSNFALTSQGTGATIYLTRSTLTGNNMAWGVDFPNATIASYSDNNIDYNNTFNSTPPGSLTYK